MKKITLKTVIWKEGKYYIAQCLNVDISTFGRTKIEAIKNIKEALALYFDGTSKKQFSKISSLSLIDTPFTYA
ncbi:MAG TPA: type II toxin-antitoxin system HicB family antitoxin [Candidatus Paceibacterota bacterium]